MRFIPKFGSFPELGVPSKGAYRGYIRIMDKKMDTI